MQCGYPGDGPLTIDFPLTEHVPSVLPASSVLVDGHPALSAALAGRRLTLGLPPPARVMCDVIGPGLLRVVVEARARLGNPTRAGRYVLGATVGSSTFSMPFTILAS